MMLANTHESINPGGDFFGVLDCWWFTLLKFQSVVLYGGALVMDHWILPLFTSFLLCEVNIHFANTWELV